MKRFKKTMKLFGLYVTVSSVPVKMKNYRSVPDRMNCDSTFRMKALRKRIKEKQDMVCPMCGEVSEQMEIHHVLPIARYPELYDDERNCVALCHYCHKEVHCNPWANIRMMEAKAAELGLDLSEKYDIGQK